MKSDRYKKPKKFHAKWPFICSKCGKRHQALTMIMRYKNGWAAVRCVQ